MKLSWPFWGLLDLAGQLERGFLWTRRVTRDLELIWIRFLTTFPDKTFHIQGLDFPCNPGPRVKSLRPLQYPSALQAQSPCKVVASRRHVGKSALGSGCVQKRVRETVQSVPYRAEGRFGALGTVSLARFWMRPEPRCTFSLRACRHVVARTLQGLCACTALASCKGCKDLTRGPVVS